MNILVYFFWWVYIYISAGSIPSSGIADLVGRHTHNFTRDCQTVFQWLHHAVCHTCPPTSAVWEFPLHCMCAMLGRVSLLHFSCSDVWGVVSLWFWFGSLMTNECEYLLVYLLTIWIFSLSFSFFSLFILVSFLPKS